MSRLFRTDRERRTLWQRIRDAAMTDVGVVVRGGLDPGSLEEIEELLLAGDFGVPATLRLVDRIEELARQGRISSETEFRSAVESEIVAMLEGTKGDRALRLDAENGAAVILVVGVNGVGKTTTIGKLSHLLRAQGRSVLLAAGDTFRAGAIDQLRIWSERAGAGFVGARPGADPAAVAFDAIDAAAARDADVVIIDTAGRLHTQGDLMAELAKVARVAARRSPGAPHETLMVLDATVGQNATSQLRTFSGALPISGLVLAKLDSSARGGIVVALEQEFGIPVKLVGTGEAADALEPFDPARFAAELLAF